MSRFTGKIALVTGSSNGIGRAAAVLFAQEGAKVTITGRNTERLEDTKQEILKAGVPEDHVLAIATDLATEEGQDELINSTIKKFGRLDILVNNAGAAFNDDQGKMGVEQNVSVYDKIMQINMRSVVTLTKSEKLPDLPYYAMSKAALDQYTRSAAIDLIQYGVRVNSVSPGGVQTGFGEAMGMPEGGMERMMKFMESRKECIPCGKVAQPMDIAYIIAFLADRKHSSYIIGQTIVADGGSTLVLGMQAHNMMDMVK